MAPEPVPAILVHGWKSHPGIWNRLVPRLQEEGIPFWSFDYTALGGATIEELALALGTYISRERKEREYYGPVDLVCHSIGSCVTRYLLEVTDGGTRRERVRQLIAIGAPNNGSALAELFCNPSVGPEIARRLTGTFVPQGFDPAADPIVRACRPDSPTMKALRAAGTRPDIAYRLICAENASRDPAFFPALDGKTCELLPGGGWQMTYSGDGIVPGSDSVLPGASLIVLPRDPAEVPSGDTGKYCHILLPRAPETIACVVGYLKGRNGNR